MTTLNLGNVALEEGKMMMIANPRQYRADCKAGAFKIGSSDMLGKTLKLEPITAKLTEDQLFSYKPQKWVEVLFVDEHGLVSSILFKGESMDNFLEIYRQVVLNKRSMIATQITARMSPRAGKKGAYFAVEFEIAGDGKYTDDIQSFANDLPVGIFRLDSIPHNGEDNGENGNGNGENGNGHTDQPDAATTAVVKSTRKH